MVDNARRNLCKTLIASAASAHFIGAAAAIHRLTAHRLPA